MSPAELKQFGLETFARIDFRLAYRLVRRVAKGDEEARREAAAWQRDGFTLFRARMCFFDRRGYDPLLRPLYLRKALRRRGV